MTVEDRPHVWIINQYALPTGAPGITRHGDLATVMAQHGIDVTVVASSFNNFTRDGKSSASSQDANEVVSRSVLPVQGSSPGQVRFAWLQTSSYVRNDTRRMFNMVEFYVRALTTQIAARFGPPDVVIGSSPHLLSGLAGLHLSRRYDARFILELRDVWPDDLVSLGAIRKGGSLHRVLAMVARQLERNADIIVTVPPKLAAHLTAGGMPSKKIVYLPNGVFLDEPSIDESVPESVDLLIRQVEGSFLVLYTGAHGQANDLANVLDAAKIVSSERPDATVNFLLFGGGQQREDLMLKAEQDGISNVRFHPPISKSALKVVAQRADVTLVHLAPAPTFDVFGRSPNKLFDYLAASKPVLYSTTDENAFVKQVGAGLIFAPGEPEALAEAVLEMVDMSEAERQAMGSRGRAALAGHHDLTVLGSRLAAIVKDLAQG